MKLRVSQLYERILSQLIQGGATKFTMAGMPPINPRMQCESNSRVNWCLCLIHKSFKNMPDKHIWHFVKKRFANLQTKEVVIKRTMLRDVSLEEEKDGRR